MATLPSAVHAQEDTTDVFGEVIQGTADGNPLPETLILTLKILSPTGEETEQFNVNSAADGSFVFEDVPIYDDGSFYVVTTFWDSIEQSSLPYRFNELSEPIEFPLYSVSQNLDQVVADRGNLRVEFVEVNELGVQMLLELQYSNLGDEIVYNADAGSFTLELPIGAFGVGFPEPPGDVPRFTEVININGLGIPGIRDTQPIIPLWPNQLFASFFVPYEEGAVFDIRFPFSVDGLTVWVREDTVLVESNVLTLSEDQETLSGRTYQVYDQTQALVAGDPFIFSLLGEPTQTVRPASSPSAATTSDDDSSAVLVFLTLTLAGLVLIGLLVYGLIRRRRQAA